MSRNNGLTIKKLNAGVERLLENVDWVEGDVDRVKGDVDRVKPVNQFKSEIQKTKPCIPPLGKMNNSPLRRI